MKNKKRKTIKELEQIDKEAIEFIPSLLPKDDPSEEDIKSIQEYYYITKQIVLGDVAVSPKIKERNVASNILSLSLYLAYFSDKNKKIDSTNNKISVSDIVNCPHLQGRSLNDAITDFLHYNTDIFAFILKKMDEKQRSDYYHNCIQLSISLLGEYGEVDKISILMNAIPDLIKENIESSIDNFASTIKELETLENFFLLNKDALDNKTNTKSYLGDNSLIQSIVGGKYKNSLLSIHVNTCKSFSHWMSDEQKDRMANLYKKAELEPDLIYSSVSDKNAIIKNIDLDKKSKFKIKKM